MHLTCITSANLPFTKVIPWNPNGIYTSSGKLAAGTPIMIDYIENDTLDLAYQELLANASLEESKKVLVSTLIQRNELALAQSYADSISDSLADNDQYKQIFSAMIEELSNASTARIYQLSPTTLTSMQGLSTNELPSSVYAQSLISLNNKSSFSRIPEYELGKGERKAQVPMKEKENLMPQGAVQIYPDPADQFVKIDFAENSLNQIVVLNNLGAVVKTSSCFGGNSLIIDVSSYSNGIYFIIGISDLGKHTLGKLAVTH